MSVLEGNALANWVVETLKELGHSEPEKWVAYLNMIPVAADEVPGELKQMLSVNRALRMVLAEADINTFDIRMLVRDDVDLETWKTYLKESVLPFMVRNGI